MPRERAKNTFDVRELPLADDEGGSVKVVRTRGINSDAWSLTHEELEELFEAVEAVVWRHRILGGM